MTKVTLYTRRACHLCEAAKREIDAARRQTPFDYDEFDIDSDPELHRLYSEEVPVIAIDGVKAFKYRLTAAELVRKLAARS